MAWTKAIECFSILSITEILCENLTAYTEIKLYRACKAIHYGNQIRRNWWQNMEHMIQITLSKHNHEKTGTPLVGMSLQERPSHGSWGIDLHIFALAQREFWENIPSSSPVRPMRREHVYSKCTRCGWRQRSYTIKGKICFEEYYCLGCGGPLLICVEIRNDKGRNKGCKNIMAQACLANYFCSNTV